MEAYAPPSED